MKPPLIDEIWKPYEKDTRNASFFIDNERIDADIKVLNEKQLKGRSLILQRQMKLSSSDITIPVGSVFTVDRLSRSLEADINGLPLVGTFTSEFN